ncbi:MAG: cysteine desulfurase family protein [Candidatus Izemoplasmatales bacterium]|nr:cysteine desulfurase family protein [Candidatus Izemoplasmatales bacterium]
MIYLDYSATTPVDPNVLDYFVETSKHFFGNPNSKHLLGIESENQIKQTSAKILSLLNMENSEVIYTSGATEANNLAIKGVANKYKNQGMHLITSPYEHSSTVASFSYLTNLGFEVEVLESRNDGLIDLAELKRKIRKDTILVSIALINSETGIVQPLEEISQIVRSNPTTIFHSDMTQAIGKIHVNANLVDLMTFAAHKFYGIKGIGALIRKNTVQLEPIIHGGTSTTSVRSGTPATPLILSLGKALECAYENFDDKFSHVVHLAEYLRNELTHCPNVFLNSTNDSVPHIINISLITVNSIALQNFLQRRGVYVSTQSACSSSNGYSQLIYKMTGDDLRAKSSIRISLSYLTSLQEVINFISIFKEEVQNASH